jgi:hypothetical protein
MGGGGRRFRRYGELKGEERGRICDNMKTYQKRPSPSLKKIDEHSKHQHHGSPLPQNPCDDSGREAAQAESQNQITSPKQKVPESDNKSPGARARKEKAFPPPEP